MSAPKPTSRPYNRDKGRPALTGTGSGAATASPLSALWDPHGWSQTASEAWTAPPRTGPDGTLTESQAHEPDAQACPAASPRADHA